MELTRKWWKIRRLSRGGRDDEDRFSLPTIDDFQPLDSQEQEEMVRSFERAHEQDNHLWRGVFAVFLLGYVAFLIYSIFQQAWNPWELRYHAYFMEEVPSWMLISAGGKQRGMEAKATEWGDEAGWRSVGSSIEVSGTSGRSKRKIGWDRGLRLWARGFGKGWRGEVDGMGRFKRGLQLGAWPSVHMKAEAGSRLSVAEVCHSRDLRIETHRIREIPSTGYEVCELWLGLRDLD
ncbi:hypothetical protein M5K25_021040 [Dendrobium thyrsiflorum]|uniref:Uncharacterized protein n=1 Tax=Dendrobium thyrsiflorum TaxID=117978 RepID=A0ABD0UIE7_DENTH